MVTLQIYWRDDRKEQSFIVAGIDFDPSGVFWYYLDDPNDRIQVNPRDYHWLRTW